MMSRLPVACRRLAARFKSFVSVAVLAGAVLPQGVSAQVGCDEPTRPDSAGPQSCLWCPTLNGPIQGATFGYTASRPTRGWCGTIENDQWWAVYPSPDGRITARLTSAADCPPQGLQMAVTSCPTDSTCHRVSNCVSSGGGSPATIEASGLDPRQVYFLQIDGFVGALCEFTLEVLTLGAGGGTQVDYGPDTTVIRYLPSACTGSTPVYGDPSDATCAYAITYAVAPAGAGVATLDDPGSGASGSRELTLAWAAPSPTRATVESIATLDPATSAPTCRDTVRQEVASHFLDQSGVYLSGDTVFDCSGERRTFLLAPGAEARILLLEDAAQRFILAGAGVAGNYLVYHYRQEATLLRRDTLDATRWSDTIRIDFGLGATRLHVFNPNPYPTEVLFQRASGSGLPYRFVQECPNVSYQVCTGESNLEIQCGVRYPLRQAGWDSVCVRLAALRNARLTDSLGVELPHVVVTGIIPFGFDASWDVAFDRFNPPAPGRYFLRAQAELTADCAALGCVSTDPAVFEIPITVTPASDTVRLPDLALPSDGSPAILFAGLPQLQTRGVFAIGDYRQAVGCVLYLQRVVGTRVTVDLGDLVICPGACARVPTGQVLACVPGTASLLATNDTVYRANIRYDATEPLVLREASYACDSLTGEWTAAVRWSGSRGPWTVDGVPVDTPFAMVGPVRGLTREIVVAGASACVQPATFRLQTSCEPVSAGEAAQRLGLAIEPNPAPQLAVRVGEGTWWVEVVDALGRVVLRGVAGAGRTDFEASRQLPGGTYWVELRRAGQRGVLTWVKE